jgi:hypothetical protein
MTPDKLRTNLASFTRNRPLPRSKHDTGMLYTAGVKYLAEAAGAFWLVDQIATSYKRAAKHGNLTGLQVWELTVTPDHRALITCESEEGNRAFEQPIPFTQFPLESITLYLVNDVLMLPSER